MACLFIDSLQVFLSFSLSFFLIPFASTYQLHHHIHKEVITDIQIHKPNIFKSDKSKSSHINTNCTKGDRMLVMAERDISQLVHPDDCVCKTTYPIQNIVYHQNSFLTWCRTIAPLLFIFVEFVCSFVYIHFYVLSQILYNFKPVIILHWRLIELEYTFIVCHISIDTYVTLNVIKLFTIFAYQ